MALQTIAVTVKSTFDVKAAFINAINNGNIATWTNYGGAFHHTTASQTAKAFITPASTVGMTQTFSVNGPTGITWADVGFAEGRFVEMLVSHFAQHIAKIEIY